MRGEAHEVPPMSLQDWSIRKPWWNLIGRRKKVGSMPLRLKKNESVYSTFWLQNLEMCFLSFMKLNPFLDKEWRQFMALNPGNFST